jgi:hypothetical protein
MSFKYSRIRRLNINALFMHLMIEIPYPRYSQYETLPVMGKIPDFSICFDFFLHKELLPDSLRHDSNSLQYWLFDHGSGCSLMSASSKQRRNF